MTTMKQLKKAIHKAIQLSRDASVPGASFDENMRREEAKQLVPGLENIDLLSDPKYKAGYVHGHKQLTDLLDFIMTATQEDLIKFAGRAR